MTDNDETVLNNELKDSILAEMDSVSVPALATVNPIAVGKEEQPAPMTIAPSIKATQPTLPTSSHMDTEMAEAAVRHP